MDHYGIQDRLNCIHSVKLAARIHLNKSAQWELSKREPLACQIPLTSAYRDLSNDSWRGDGCCVHTETSSDGDRSGFFGRGLQGLVNTVLQIFGI